MTRMKDENSTTSAERPKRYIPQRYIFGLLGFMALSNAYVQRFSLSLTITEMTDSNHDLIPTKNAEDVECPVGEIIITNRTSRTQLYEFSWDEKTQGIILSSVFWGYVVGQLPGGMIADRYGGKHTLGFGMLFCILCNLSLPFVVRKFEAIGLIVLRFFIGLGQGPLYPSLNVILSHWAPFHERGRLGALVFAGAQVGNVISMAVTGIIIQKLGWPYVFYIYGFFGIVWYIVWITFISDKPSTHRFISEHEKKYLEENVHDITDERKNLPSTPWKKILTSGPVWGVVIAQIGHDWGLFTIITDLPKYMKSVLHLSVAENGTLSALPYLNMWIFALFSGYVCDWLIEKKGFGITIVRKIFVTTAATGPALGIIAASYSYCNRVAVITSFTIGMGLMGAFVPSLKVNPLDLSPNFAGSLMAFVGGTGAISGIFAPFVVGVLTTHGTLTEWRNVFWIAFYVLIVTNIVYFILGSGEVQPWNEEASSSDADQTEDDPSRRNTIPEISIQEGAERAEFKRKMSYINGIPIDPSRRRSVFVERPLIF
ncbi:putative inorganic phosphate cotransporter [Planococcus citri]|uniref:putative inorganic phosphate cotransporter n=1 Tax=Planococcus citri TaxID=170843 RepID=UPI0031F74991